MSTILYVDLDYLSPAAMSAFVALNEKALEFDLVTVDLKSGAQRAHEYAEMSLTGRVPTLSHDGFSISESSAIAEYLDEAVPGVPLFPVDIRQRAQARQLQAWLRSDLSALRKQRPSDTIFRPSEPEPLDTEAQFAATKLVNAIEQLLPEGTTQLFDNWSIADFDAALMLARLTRNGDQVPERLARFSRSQLQRPSFAGWPAW